MNESTGDIIVRLQNYDCTDDAQNGRKDSNHVKILTLPGLAPTKRFVYCCIPNMVPSLKEFILIDIVVLCCVVLCCS